LHPRFIPVNKQGKFLKCQQHRIGQLTFTCPAINKHVTPRQQDYKDRKAERKKGCKNDRKHIRKMKERWKDRDRKRY
jgi:hypothetical protein